MTRAEFHKIWTAEIKKLTKTLRDNECIYYAELQLHDAPEGYGLEIAAKIILERKNHAPQ